MQIPVSISAVFVSTATLLSCRQQQPPQDVDPTLGRDCFESHQPSLPPGSQYEGIAQASDHRISIRAMTGTQVETFDCSLKADGTVAKTRDGD
ncbi:MAG: hypothetical protein VBE63_21665 [Lamprobacter sp.]|uniref:hypothetical protein n=1 Tax=Lamprobacter sp. TaxID=3100796 RepID=UPI002B2638A4|nr:hypothetical protein [Lamprobacter sp.]MEA3642525.1 hypothetical protein [Lamprobacter sp.]